jgi:hypothetical protein
MMESTCNCNIKVQYLVALKSESMRVVSLIRGDRLIGSVRGPSDRGRADRRGAVGDVVRKDRNRRSQRLGQSLGVKRAERLSAADPDAFGRGPIDPRRDARDVGLDHPPQPKSKPLIGIEIPL